MKKNKETIERSRWQQWQQSPGFFKKFLIGLTLSIILILSVIILIHRYINKTTQQPVFVFQEPAAPNPIPVPAPILEPGPAPTPPPTLPVPSPEAALLQNEITLQNNHLTQLENTLSQLQPISQISHQLIVLELFHEILEGDLPLNTLDLYLQKNSEPWAINILSSISLIKECKTYLQLQALLVLPTPSLSRWQRIKNILKSLVRIRKLDAEGHYIVGNLDDIQRALRAHNIQQALDVFGKLPPDDQAQLSWKQNAEDRLTLETIKKKILLELAGVNQ